MTELKFNPLLNKHERKGMSSGSCSQLLGRTRMRAQVFSVPGQEASKVETHAYLDDSHSQKGDLVQRKICQFGR